MMKKTISMLFVSLMMIMFVPGVFAENAATPAPRKTREQIEAYKNEMNAEKIQNREEIQVKNTERVELRQEKRSDVAEKHALRLEERFALYYQRLSDLEAKIRARLVIMTKEGKDVSASEAKLEEAKKMLEEAKMTGDQAVAGFKTINPDTYEEQRVQVMAARDLAEKAREQYKMAVKLMKEAFSLAKNII